MKKGETRQLETIMVQGVSSAATPDGRISLVLHLKDRTIALEMNQPRIDDLRRNLADIETFLRQKAGRA